MNWLEKPGISKYAIPAPTAISRVIKINIKNVMNLNSLLRFDLINTK